MKTKLRRMNKEKQEDNKKWHTYFLVDGDWRLWCTSHEAEGASRPTTPISAGFCALSWRKIRLQPTGRQPSSHGISYFDPTGEDQCRRLRRRRTHLPQSDGDCSEPSWRMAVGRIALVRVPRGRSCGSPMLTNDLPTPTPVALVEVICLRRQRSLESHPLLCRFVVIASFHC